MNSTHVDPNIDDKDDQPTSPRSPLAEYPPLPPQVEGGGKPQEIYGFVAWITTSLAFILYLLWGFLPDEWIQAMGIHWYPNREWALLLPAYSVVIIMLTYFTYWALAIAGTPSFSELRTVTDSFAHIPSIPADPSQNPYRLGLAPGAIPETYDMPIGLVNHLAFGKRKRPKRRPTSDSPFESTDTTSK